MSEVHTTCKSSSKSESISSASVHQFIPTFEYVFLGLIFLRRWSWWRIATTSWFILRDLADHYKSILRGVARVFKSRRSSSELLVKQTSTLVDFHYTKCGEHMLQLSIGCWKGKEKFCKSQGVSPFRWAWRVEKSQSDNPGKQKYSGLHMQSCQRTPLWWHHCLPVRLAVK